MITLRRVEQHLTTWPWPLDALARLIAVALVPVVIVAAVALLAIRFTALPDGVALRVDGHEVTEQDLRAQGLSLQALYGVSVPPDADPRSDGFRRMLARTVVRSHVIDRAIAERNLQVTPEQAGEALDQTILQDYGSGGQEAFAKVLATVGTSRAAVVAEVAWQQGTARLFGSVAAATGPPVSDQEVQRAYVERPDLVARPEQRHLINIVVDDPQRAAEAATRARAGEDLASLAATYSMDPTTRDAGGDIGFVARAGLEDAYGAAAFGSPVGAVFGPVESSHGWNVGQVRELRPATTPPIEQVTEQLRARLADERAQQRWSTFMDDALRRADVEYADSFRPLGDAPVRDEQSVPSPAGAQ